MKVVIQTQIRENYGAHDWDGQGEVPQYWKCKGGNTYVVEGLSEAQAAKAVETGCPTLTKLIARFDNYFEEMIIGIHAAQDSEVVCDEWEAPMVLSYTNGKWIGTTSDVNMGQFRKQIAKRIVTEVLGEEGSAKVQFEMVDGRVLSYKEATEELLAA